MPDEAVWPSAVVKWEVGLLQALGFGLDSVRLRRHRKPRRPRLRLARTGRAVSRSAGAPYHDRLLALPPFLLAPGAAGTAADAVAGLALTGHFLERDLFRVRGRGLPPARLRLVDLLRRAAAREQASSVASS